MHKKKHQPDIRNGAAGTWGNRSPGHRYGRRAWICCVMVGSCFLGCGVAGVYTGDALRSVGLRANTKAHAQDVGVLLDGFSHWAGVCVCVRQWLTLTLRLLLELDNLSGVWERKLLGTEDCTALPLKTTQKSSANLWRSRHSFHQK